MSVYIRPIEIRDAELILDWENNVEGWNMEESDTPYSLFDILQLIHELQDVSTSKQARWVICNEDDHRRVGVVDLTDINFEKKEASVGVLVAEPVDRNNGIATKSLGFLEKQATELGVTRLFSSILVNNLSSIRLFEKCGFKKIGKTDATYLIDGAYIEALLFEKWLEK